ncbi:protein NBR1-like protein isoform X2 [Senna tora]|uniref:Protein NBR1-like protein isoform X2 n=1 Tax=Senna tora TaxID=362788 RepID=A0A834X4X2_9FABA|nr:protein NBR1-like protein isoform X2 [Senna tora]
MASTLVVKVKCEDILRRFNVRVKEKNELDIDIVGLRFKIISLFLFLADSNFILRYVDEDGDLVTLVDDDDLRDIMRQKLKFLRIDVVEITNESDDLYNIAPTFPPLKNPFTSANIAFAFEAFKSLAKPLCVFASNATLDLVSKLVSSIELDLFEDDSDPSQFTEVNTASSVVANGGDDGKEVEIMDSTVVKDENENDICLISNAKKDSSQSVMSHDDDDDYSGGCGIHKLDGHGPWPWRWIRSQSRESQEDGFCKCGICFDNLRDGSYNGAADYIRMDDPVLDGIDERPPPRTGSCGTTFPAAKSTGNYMIPMLDSEFTFDVNVVDGTKMAPSTKFTKIWRMRNTGIIAWPQGTQMVWIGGDKISDFNSVTLKIPPNGVSVHKEFDVAIEFRAPKSRGNYLSYWRMACPSGSEFGQNVRVFIQVDDVPQVLTLKKWPTAKDTNVEPVVDDDASLQSYNSYNADFSEDMKDVSSSSLVEKIERLEVAVRKELKEMGYEKKILEESLEDLFGGSMWEAIINGRVKISDGN